MRALYITNSITRKDQKSLDKYLNDISKYDVLTADEEERLFRDWREGDEAAFSRIVTHNLRFVVSVAKKYQNMGMGLSDLINEGNVGLIKAARRFDVSRGFKFISYAVWWIRQSILQALSDKGRKIRVPLNMTGNMAKVRRKMIEILQREEREATIDELAAETDLTPDMILKCMENFGRCPSLDAPVKEEGTATMGHLIADESLHEPDHELAVKETQQSDIRRMLSTLPAREQKVLTMYYGIGMSYPVSLSSISDRVGLSRERIRQIKDRAIARLRVRASGFTPTFSQN